jgi:hypothetical protein
MDYEITQFDLGKQSTGSNSEEESDLGDFGDWMKLN